MKTTLKLIAAALMLSWGGAANATTLQGLSVDITSVHGSCAAITVGAGPECIIWDTAAQNDDFLQVDIQTNSIVFSIIEAANNGGSFWTTAPRVFDVVVTGLTGFSVLGTALDLNGNTQAGGTLSATLSNPGELTFTFNNFDVFCGLETCASLTVTGEVAPIPLPAGLPLLLAGLGAVGVMGRKRRAA